MGFALDSQLGSAYTQPGAVGSAPFTTTAVATAGSLIIVGVGVAMDTGLTIASLAGGGLTWAKDISLNNSFDNAAIFSAYAPAGLGSGIVLTVSYSGTATGSDMSIGATSFFGGLSAGALDKTSTRSQASTAAWTANAMAGTTAGDLIIGVSFGDGNLAVGSTDAPNANYSQAFKQTGAGSDGATMIFNLAGAGGSVTAGGTWSAAPTNAVNVSAAYFAAPPAPFHQPFLPLMAPQGM